MHLTVVVEHRFLRTPDGATWTATALARDHWRRYAAAFDTVRVLARAEDVPASDPRWRRVDGDGVEVAPVPYYVGPAQYVARAVAVRRAIERALAARPRGAVILRVPGTLGGIAAGALRAARRPFALEVVGDPHEVFAPGSLDHPLRPLLRAWTTRALRTLCARAAAALYVAPVLRARYPLAAGHARAFVASDVELGDGAFVAAPRAPAVAGPLRLVTVATLEQLYKSPDVLIEAVARCARRGVDVELAIVGDGRHRPALEALAARLGVAASVRFTGRLPAGAAVRAELDRADLFVLPSRTEGMPRAMLEAMARGLPCLGTPVGGIPDLLPPDALVPPEAGALAERIAALAARPELRAAWAAEALRRARGYHESALVPVRAAFLAAIAAFTDGASAPARGARAPAGAARRSGGASPRGETQTTSPHAVRADHIVPGAHR